MVDFLVVVGHLMPVRGTIPGPAVRELREALRLSVTDFAAVLGVHPNSVHRWERLPEAPVEGMPHALLTALHQRLIVDQTPDESADEVGKRVKRELAIGGMVLALAFLFVFLAMGKGKQ